MSVEFFLLILGLGPAAFLPLWWIVYNDVMLDTLALRNFDCWADKICTLIVFLTHTYYPFALWVMLK